MIRERQKKEQKNIVAYAVIGACVVSMVAFIVNMALGDKPNELQKNGCIGEGVEGTSVIVDYSPPLFGEAQKRALAEYFSMLYRDRLQSNERLTIYGTHGTDWSTIPKATLSICKPVRTAEEAKRFGGPEVSDQWLKNQDEKVFARQYWPAIESMLSTKPDTKDAMKDSPIMELVQSMSRVGAFTGRPFKRLVLVSDLIQNADSNSFCYRQDQRVPEYKHFAKSAHMRRVQPEPLTGVEVEVLMLGRESLKLFCTADELEDFWRDFMMKGGGASSFKAIRLREGI